VPRQTRLIYVGGVLFVLLSSVYLLTYRGLFRSVDELALFALTESVVQTGSFRTPQLAFAEYHNPVGRLEPLHALLSAPLYWVAVHSGRLGNIQTTMLLNVLVTAATGVVLYALFLSLGHPLRPAVCYALLYGLGTLAWPYSRSFFREPLAAFLLAVAMLGLLRWQQTRRPAFVVCMLLCLGLALATKITSFLAWPGFALAFILEPGISARARSRRVLGTALVGVVGVMAAAIAYVVRMDVGLPAIFRLWTAYASPGLVFSRLLGLTLGAGRGLFVFAPVLLGALPGGVLLWRKQRAAAVLSMAVFLSFVVGYSAYGDWHAGMSWGPRFLVPVIPFLMLPLAEWVSGGGKWRRGAAAVLAVASFAVQLVASTANYSLQIEAEAWANLWDYAHSPAVQQFVLWRPAHFDMLWWHGPVRDHLDHVVVNVGLGVPLFITLIGAVSVLLVARRGSARTLRLSSILLGWVWAVGCVAFMLQAPAAGFGYPGADPAELRQVAQLVNQDRDEPHVIVTVSNDFHLNVLLDGFKGRFVYHWLSPLQSEGFEDLVQAPFPARSLRLIVDRVHAARGYSAGAAELWLNAHLYRYYVDWLGSGYQVYSYLYPPPDRVPVEVVDWTWEAGMTMSGYGMTPRVVAPGEPMWLEFHCSAAQSPGADYDIFVQLLAPDGRFVNGTDGAPQFGGRPTSGWQPGEGIVDRRAVFVPADSSPGAYRVIAGFYRGGERQPLVSGGAAALDHVELGEILVESRSP
jgi:hypothetical protein